jgi:16S rRNA (guanine1207-N2)-methyltransferase
MPAPTATDRVLVRRRLLSLLDLRPGDAVLVASPFAAELVGALGRAVPDGRVDAVVADLRLAAAPATAEGDAAPAPIRVVPGVTLADAGGAVPDVVLLWPDGREGHARTGAHVREAAARLRPGGSFYLVAFSRSGAARHVATVRAAFGDAEVLARGPRGARIVRAVKPRPAGRPGAAGEARPRPRRAPDGEADDSPGETFRVEVRGRPFWFRSGPGVFARNGLDPGTRLLLETLLETPPGPERTALDLGCGYGPVGIILAAFRPGLRVTLVDVDARAVALTRANVLRNGVTGNTSVRLSDGLRHLPGQTFDLVASHFPLHLGRDEAQRLLTEGRDALTPGGRFWLAALAAYDLRPLVDAVFGPGSSALERAPGGSGRARYRVLCARAPQRLKERERPR